MCGYTWQMLFYRNLISKINALPLFSLLFCILLFYLPFQYRYEHLVKKLLYPLFSSEFNTFLRLDGSLGIYLTDFLMVGMIFSLPSQKMRGLFWEGSRKYLTLFLLFSLISLIHSPHGKEAWVYYPYIFQLLLPALFFYTLSAFSDLKELLHKTFWIFFAVMIVQSLIAILQYIEQSELGLAKLGEPHLFAIVCIPEKMKWTLDAIFNTKTLSIEILRASGTLPHPNILGCFLPISLLITYTLYLQLDKRGVRALFILPLFLQWLALFLTYCRAGIIGAVFGSFCSLSYFIYKRSKGAKLLALKIAGCIALCFALLLPQIVARGGIVNYNEVAQDSDRGRHIYQAWTIKQIEEHPLLGIGFHQSLVLLKESGIKGDAAHNIYLLIGAENGLISLAFFLSFIGSTLWHALRKQMDGATLTLLGIFLFLLFSGLCHYDLVKSQQGRLLFFISAAFLSYRYEYSSKN